MDRVNIGEWREWKGRGGGLVDQRRGGSGRGGGRRDQSEQSEHRGVEGQGGCG